MRFFNRYILLYAAIVLVATLILYYIASILFTTGRDTWFTWVFFGYLLLIFACAFFIGWKDIYHRYAGLNYHLSTYIISNGTPIVLALCGFIPRDVMHGIFSAMLFWGIGLLFHVAMYLFIFRKKGIRNYDKEDVFK